MELEFTANIILLVDSGPHEAQFQRRRSGVPSLSETDLANGSESVDGTE